jgi:hypothetical protein
MKAKKLRIGNLVGIKKTALHADGCNTENDYFEIEELKKDVVEFKGFYAGEYYKDLKGIELNAGLLSLYGFDDSEYKKGYTGVEFRTNLIMDFVLTKPKFMGEWQDTYCFDLGKHRFVPVRYVHELQNLFFAITTTELEIKQNVSTCT